MGNFQSLEHEAEDFVKDEFAHLKKEFPLTMEFISSLYGTATGSWAATAIRVVSTMNFLVTLLVLTLMTIHSSWQLPIMSEAGIFTMICHVVLFSLTPSVLSYHKSARAFHSQSTILHVMTLIAGVFALIQVAKKHGECDSGSGQAFFCKEEDISSFTSFCSPISQGYCPARGTPEAKWHKTISTIEIIVLVYQLISTFVNTILGYLFMDDFMKHHAKVREAMRDRSRLESMKDKPKKRGHGRLKEMGDGIGYENEDDGQEGMVLQSY
jgi:hypothetical protein